MHINIFRKKELKQILSFCIIGSMNTIFGSIGMLFLYNMLEFGYWGSSIVVYIIGSVFSFFANKHLTFKKQEKKLSEIIKFIISILICYIIAYSISLPILEKLLLYHLSFDGIQQLSMIMGMFIFTILNFISQKVFVFKA